MLCLSFWTFRLRSRQASWRIPFWLRFLNRCFASHIEMTWSAIHCLHLSFWAKRRISYRVWHKFHELSRIPMSFLRKQESFSFWDGGFPRAREWQGRIVSGSFVLGWDAETSSAWRRISTCHFERMWEIYWIVEISQSMLCISFRNDCLLALSSWAESKGGQGISTALDVT